MLTTGDLYDRYHRDLWRAWNNRFRTRLAAAYPETGGIELYVHNWIVCDRKNLERADQAQAMISAEWAAWHKIADRGKREYDRLDHKLNHGPTFRPLWCRQGCQN